MISHLLKPEESSSNKSLRTLEETTDSQGKHLSQHSPASSMNPENIHFLQQKKSIKKHYHKKRKRHSSRVTNNIALVLLPLIIFGGLIFLAFHFKGRQTEQTSAISTVSAVEDIQMPAIFSETTANDEESIQDLIYVTTTNVNVRIQPSTDSTILTTLDSNTIVDYVEEYDEIWSVILYEGEEAYVSSQFITTQ